MRTRYPRPQGTCHICEQNEAVVYAEGQWICIDCEIDLAQEDPEMPAKDLASILWGCQAKLIRGGQYGKD
jgi:hypothetical protein